MIASIVDNRVWPLLLNVKVFACSWVWGIRMLSDQIDWLLLVHSYWLADLLAGA